MNPSILRIGGSGSGSKINLQMISAIAAMQSIGGGFVDRSMPVTGRNVGKTARKYIAPDDRSATGCISKLDRKKRNKALKRTKQSRKKNRK